VDRKDEKRRETLSLPPLFSYSYPLSLSCRSSQLLDRVRTSLRLVHEKGCEVLAKHSNLLIFNDLHTVPLLGWSLKPETAIMNHDPRNFIPDHIQMCDPDPTELSGIQFFNLGPNVLIHGAIRWTYSDSDEAKWQIWNHRIQEYLFLRPEIDAEQEVIDKLNLAYKEYIKSPAQKVIDNMSEEFLLSVWNALGVGFYGGHPGPHGCKTMDDWAELIYAEIGYRKSIGLIKGVIGTPIGLWHIPRKKEEN